MTPVDQRYLTGNSEGVPGDCVRACVASILDLDLDAVPHFVQLHDGLWCSALDDWCDERGIELMWLDGHYAYDFPIMLTGKSPRGDDLRHAVVGIGGEIAHDPHPSRNGLIGLADRSFLFVPKTVNWSRHFKEYK